MRFRGSLWRWWRKSKPKLQKFLVQPPQGKIVDSGDFRMCLHPEDNYTERYFSQNGRFPEEESMQWFAEKLANKNALFLDIGANAGVFALKVSLAMAANGQILAFEPNPVLVDRLRTNIALNGIKNIEIFACALGAEPGSQRLSFRRLPEENLGAASLLKHRHQSGTVGVKVRTLLSCMPKNAADFDLIALKIDIEGYEDRVLAPFFETATDDLHPNFVLLEIDHCDRWATDVRPILLAHGYRDVGSMNNNQGFEKVRV